MTLTNAPSQISKCLLAATILTSLTLSSTQCLAKTKLRPLVRKLMKHCHEKDSEEWSKLSQAVLKDRTIKTKDLLEELQYCFANPEGKAQTGQFELKVDDDEKPVHFYVPKTYSPKKSWPLMILLHGTNGTGKGTLETALMALKKEDWILVAPSLKKPSIGSAMSTAGSTGFGWGDHKQCLAVQSYRAALKRYRIDTNRVYLFGVSLGGYGAWSAGTAYWDRWAAVVPYAGGIDYRENSKLTADLIPKGGIPKGYAPKGLGAISGEGRRRDLLINLFNTPFFFIHGAKDTVVEPLGDRRSEKELKTLGYKNWKYYEDPKWGHIPDKKDLDKLLGMLTSFCKKHSRPSAPRAIRHFAPRKDNNRAAWLELVDFKPGAKITATLKKNNVVLEGSGVQTVRLYFNKHNASLRKKLKVYKGRRRIASVKLKQSKAALLESLRSYYDPERLYPVMVDLKLSS